MTSFATVFTLIQAALQAVDPYGAVRAHLQKQGQFLFVDDKKLNLDNFEHIYVLGAGKAGAPMAQAIEDILGERISGGCVVVKYGHQSPTRRLHILQAGHPLPDQAGLEAGQQILALAQAATADDLVLCLISGGGSALLESLPPALSLADLQTTTDLLLASGATIHEFNTVRKHLSLIKGGQLGRAASPATLLTLVLSDVVGSPLQIIASGPTVPDPSTWAQAWEIVEKYDLVQRLPATVRHRLHAGLIGELPDTPKPGAALFDRSHTLLIGDNATAAQAAAQTAVRRGYNTQILSTFIEGEAREIAKVAVALAREVRHHQRPVAPPACLILGGETTVTLGAEPGLGGRNQELALAAALALDAMPGITIVALATDGSDGPTDAAGAWVDGRTLARARALGLSAHQALRTHNAYPLLAQVGALLHTGPTRTNVNDLIFILVDPTPSPTLKAND
ncbi:MAG: glycerate kinase [Chloroflexi bacterium]|nr:glycerate kinase [Chloroflexota bacterium]